MSNSTSNPNAENSTLDAAAELRENMNYIEKFGLPPSVAQHIDSRLILNDVHIDDPTIASDIELNSYVLHCLESYQLSQSLVVDYMLEVFREEFHGWGYTEFSRLDKYIRRVLKETFMTKGIYMGRPGGHVNQRLANLVIDEQLPIWDENDLRKYKKMYPTSKAWVLLELQESPMPQQLTRSIEAKISLINDRRQQSFTLGSANVTPDPANARGSTPAHPIQVPTAQVLPIQVSLAQVLPIPAATIQAPLSVPLAPSATAEHCHEQLEMHPEQVKIVSDKLDTFTNKYADAQLSASGQKEIQGLLEKDVFKVVTPEEVPSSTQVFNSRFVDDIKDPCTDKAYEKSRPVVHAYNDEKKNLVLMHSPKIPGVRQSIGSCLAAIIRDDDNDNIRFYLRDITQAYVEIASDLNPDFYIRPLSELISQLSATFDSIVKVMRPLYGEPEADNHGFAIYHPHYKEKPGMTESAHDPFLLRPPPKLLSPPGASSDSCGWRYLAAAFFLAHDGGACIAEPGMRIDLPKVPLILCTDSYSLYQCLVQLEKNSEKRLMIDIMALRQLYEGREIDEIRWICGKDSPADAMTKASPNSALEGIISTIKATIGLEGWVKR